MKAIHHQMLRSTVLLCLLVAFFSCSKNKNTEPQQYTYTIYTPVYKSKTEVLATINATTIPAVEHAGKLYIKDNFIYLNEVDKGVHIIDNSDPAHPAQVAFLSIPGNLDIAIRDNILYADMYDDLLALDISNPLHAVLTGSLHNFFTGRAYVNGQFATTEDKVAVDWTTKDTTILVDEQNYCRECWYALQNSGGTKSSGTGSSGTAGSMAAMVLMNDHLYAITEMHSLGIVDISNPSSPQLDSTFFAGYDLQTIYPFEGKLFLGSAIGMFMYDVSDPQNPVSVGQFSHGRACDPVVADGSYAYVTLHAGEACGGDQNELNVIDIKDLQNSQLVKTYPLTKPTGLCKDGNLLFVCDGTNVKIFDATDPAGLVQKQTISSNEPYDVIATNNTAMVVTNEGLFQYDYSNLNNIRQLSFFAAKK